MVWNSQNDDIRNAKTGCTTNLKPKTTTNQLINFADVTSVPSIPLPSGGFLGLSLVHLTYSFKVGEEIYSCPYIQLRVLGQC